MQESKEIEQELTKVLRSGKTRRIVFDIDEAAFKDTEIAVLEIVLRISKEACVMDDVTVIDDKPGNRRITVVATKEDAERYVQAFKDGKLTPLGVRSVHVTNEETVSFLANILAPTPHLTADTLPEFWRSCKEKTVSQFSITNMEIMPQSNVMLAIVATVDDARRFLFSFASGDLENLGVSRLIIDKSMISRILPLRVLDDIRHWPLSVTKEELRMLIRKQQELIRDNDDGETFLG